MAVVVVSEFAASSATISKGKHSSYCIFRVDENTKNSASDSRSEEFEFESLWPHLAAPPTITTKSLFIASHFCPQKNKPDKGGGKTCSPTPQRIFRHRNSNTGRSGESRVS